MRSKATGEGTDSSAISVERPLNMENGRVPGNAKRLVAKVALDLSSPELKLTYDYLVPDDMVDSIAPGSTVVVPVRGSRCLGYVIDLHEPPKTDGLKAINALIADAKLIGPRQLALSRWLADYYLTNLNDAVRLVLPPGGRHKVRAFVEIDEAGHDVLSDDLGPAFSWLADHGGRAPKRKMERLFGEGEVNKLLRHDHLLTQYSLTEPALKTKTKDFISLVDPVERAPGRLGPKQLAVLDELGRKSPQPLRELLRAVDADRGVVNALLKKGLVDLFTRQEERLTNTAFTETRPAPFDLNNDQTRALGIINRSISEGRHRTILLDGVTGSGKTEVYMKAAEETLAQGRTAIFLSPEIALLPQLVERLAWRFGNQVAVLHSGLAAGERFDAWRAVASGAKKIVVGARSALFAPADNIGLIVLDEEHETSYKQNSHPRYDARVVAVKIGELHQAVVLMGSATPSLEAQALAGKESRLELKERIAGFNRPAIKIIDMREELLARNFSIFSDALVESLDAVLSQGHKAILLINRRGFANFLLCRKCGYVPACPNCSVSLTFHRVGNRLHCHHCDARTVAAEGCPQCSNTDWKFTGAGTQRVESDLAELFPGVPVIRMDGDTTGGQGAHHTKLLQFYKTKGAILLGTQMIAKGLDFPDVALVGIVNADTSINLPDFRAAERTAQLLTQVSGRSGRGSIPGEVVIQTYNPDNYAVQAVTADYSAFCAIELEHRRELGYPPFSSLINFIFSSRDETAAGKISDDVARRLGEAIGDLGLILGPAPAPIAKIKGFWRRHLIVMTQDPEGVKSLLRNNKDLTQAPGQVKIIIDIDPVWLL